MLYRLLCILQQFTLCYYLAGCYLVIKIDLRCSLRKSQCLCYSSVTSFLCGAPPPKKHPGSANEKAQISVIATCLRTSFPFSIFRVLGMYEILRRNINKRY